MAEPTCVHCTPDSVVHAVGTTPHTAIRDRETVYQCSECNRYTTENHQPIDHQSIIFYPTKSG